MARKSSPKDSAVSYFKRYPAYNALIHATGGIGLGILLTHSVIDPHPMRWGLGLIALAILGHIYPWVLKK